jgi:hypothetical protein
MTNLLKFTISVRKSHRQPQCTLELESDDRVFLVWVDHARFFMRALASKVRPSTFLVYSPFFYELHLSSNPTNKNLTS